MANWALIIGINQYWEPSRQLKGAVNDAMRMLEWLMSSTDCHVPPENIFLLTRPSPVLIPAGVKHRDAIADELLTVIPELGKISDQQEVDRFFFYFSGHGITNLESVSSGDEQCLVMADFNETLTNKAVKFNSIKDFFKATRFREQFFFIDACRNLLQWPFKFETGSTTVKREIDIKQEPVEQFILNSTAPRSKSFEGLEPTASPGEEKGAFTGALLDGLNGDGAAKVYDSNNNEYLIRKESLFDYVINKVIARKIFVIKDPVNPVIQRPLKDGEHSKNPVLVKIPFDSVKPERLELFVEPNTVWPVAKLSIGDERHEFQADFQPPVTNVPLPLAPLPPMIYTVHASAPDHILEGKNPKLRSFPLYESTEVSVRLVPVQPSPGVSTIAAEPPVSAGGGGPVALAGDSMEETPELALAVKSLEDDAGSKAIVLESPPANVTTAESSDDLGILVVESDDPLASLEIGSSTGELLSLGHGHLQLTTPNRGFYCARLIAPEGQSVEEFLEVVPGEKETVRLEGPSLPSSPLLEDVVKKAGFIEDKNNQTFDLSKAAGPASSVRLSTILSLAALAADHNPGWGNRLRALQVTPFNQPFDAERTAGLQILTGIESLQANDSVKYLSAVTMRLWQQGTEIPEGKVNLTPLSSTPGLAEFSTAARPGPHWLSVEIPNEISAIFSLYLPPQHITLLVFHRDVTGRTQVFQYVLGIHPSVNASPELMRRCELIQRFCMNGRFKNAYDFAREQLAEEDVDAIACCVGGYLALMAHDIERLRTAIRKLNIRCPDLSDAFVLAGGAYELAGNEDEARIAYAGALDKGIPVFANGISRLHAGLSRTNVEHPRKRLLTTILNIRLRGLLWSACAGPEHLAPGRLFEEQIVQSQMVQARSSTN